MEMLNIGSAPTEEPCVQVLEGVDYLEAMLIETQVYRDRLKVKFPEPEKGYFAIKTFNHDFGRYYEVVAMYDPLDDRAVAWAFAAEDGAYRWQPQDLDILRKNPAWVAAKKS